MKSWTDLDTHGKRLTRIIRKLEKQFNKSLTAYEKINCANAISGLTKQTVEITKIHLGIKDAVEKAVPRFGK